MFNFWYSERCTRPLKLTVCIATCFLIYWSSNSTQLTPLWAIISLCIGMLTHYLHTLIASKPQKIDRHREQIYKWGFPIIAMISIYVIQGKLRHWELGLQILGYTALGVFILATYQHRTPR